MKLNIHDKIKELEERYAIKVVYCVKSGSALYGTNTQSSDTDYTGIFIPNPLSVLVKRDLEHYSSTTGENNQKNEVSDVDVTLYSIHKFMNLLKKGETGALDLLFSLQAQHLEDLVEIHEKAYMDLIEEQIPNLISKNLQSFLGYCLTQAKRYNIKGARYNEYIILMEGVNKYITESNVNLNDSLRYLGTEIDKIISKNDLKYIRYVLARGPKRFVEENVWYLEILGRKHMVDITIQEFLERMNKLNDSFGNRTIAAQDGVDNKALSHATRVILECRWLLETGKIIFPLPFKGLIKTIKYHDNLKDGSDNVTFELNGVDTKLNLDSLMIYLECQLDIVQNLILNSDLPEEVNQEIIDAIILKELALYPAQGK